MPDLSADDASVRGHDSGLPPRYWIDRLDGEADLDGVLEVEGESFTNPWTREMYNWELQNRSVCHIFVARTRECPVAGFCAFWLVLDEIHINNVAVRPQFPWRGDGIRAAAPCAREAKQLGARRATLGCAHRTRRQDACTNGWAFLSRPPGAITTQTGGRRARPVARRARLRR